MRKCRRKAETINDDGYEYNVRTDLALEQRERFDSDQIEIPGSCCGGRPMMTMCEDA